MELPEDVLVLIREYAKPRFTYFREYNNLLKLLRKKEWPSLKSKLQSEPEVVLPALLAYQSAIVRRIEFYQEMITMKQTQFWRENWDEANAYFNRGCYCRIDEDDTLWKLKRILGSLFIQQIQSHQGPVH